ncbi:max-interacting protein 1-like [Culicoides brevitarsis]|uniref:max-interacting protein 1-like n=1 Tax=Culicoides brevitarsis TaxID=469753 RepID=UPI00307B5554
MESKLSVEMNIAVLLQAAEYLERREREQEHGYANTFTVPKAATHKLAPPLLPPINSAKGIVGGSNNASSITTSVIVTNNNRRQRGKKGQGNRSTHNELEKNRRAHLRNCLERLKEIVPLGSDASRHTTLGLLTKAKRFIKNLERKERNQTIYIEQLSKKQRFLKWRVEQLVTYNEAMCKRRSVSECSSSSSTISSTNSLECMRSFTSISSEPDEIDVIGYSSNQSDTDDHLSEKSMKSTGSTDSGVIMSASRLTIDTDDMEI